jgi:hypothetical protein
MFQDAFQDWKKTLEAVYRRWRELHGRRQVLSHCKLINKCFKKEVWFLFGQAMYFNEMTDAEHLVKYEVFTVVTMKNVVFGDIKTQFIPDRRHIMSPLHRPAS